MARGACARRRLRSRRLIRRDLPRRGEFAAALPILTRYLLRRLDPLPCGIAAPALVAHRTDAAFVLGQSARQLLCRGSRYSRCWCIWRCGMSAAVSMPTVAVI